MVIRSLKAVAVATLLSCQAIAAGLEPALGSTDPTRLLTTYCIETDAKASRAEALIMSLKLPADSIALKQIAGGINIRLDLGSGTSLDLDIEAGGQVRSCQVVVKLDELEPTFAAFQKRFFLGGSLTDYDAGNKEWVDIDSPGGIALSALFTFTGAPGGANGGTLSATVTPAER